MTMTHHANEETEPCSTYIQLLQVLNLWTTCGKWLHIHIWTTKHYYNWAILGLVLMQDKEYKIENQDLRFFSVRNPAWTKFWHSHKFQSGSITLTKWKYHSPWVYHYLGDLQFSMDF